MLRLTALCKLLALVCLCAGLCACGKPRIDLAVASQPNVNPDHSGRPSPVIIKMYELRGDLAFKQSDFQTLFANPMQALGPDLVAADEVVFVPSEAKTISYEPMPETRFVGIVAGFRQMDRAHWRIIVPVDPETKNRIPLELNDVFLTLIGQERDDWTPEDSLRQQQSRMVKQPVYAEPESGDGLEVTAGTNAQQGTTARGGGNLSSSTSTGSAGSAGSTGLTGSTGSTGSTGGSNAVMPHSKRAP